MLFAGATVDDQHADRCAWLVLLLLFFFLFPLQGDPALLSIDLSSTDFLTQLIDLASSVVITSASHTFHNFLYRHCSTNHGYVANSRGLPGAE
jgi:hypothetical protein